MKKILLISLTTIMCFVGFMSCDDWTETEAKVFDKGDGKSDEYYANLRKWKAETQHDMAFGWYGFWSGEGVSLKSSMRGLPDSIHHISVWGPWSPSTLTESKKADLKFVQEVKGTKVTATVITGWVGSGIMSNMNDYAEKERRYGWEQDWNTSSSWVSKDPAVRARQEESIRRYARDIKDSIFTAGYDGFDIDYEPMAGGSGCKQEMAQDDNFLIFVDELGKYMGPKSGTDKLLVIDGELHNMPGSTVPYFDLFIAQVYSHGSNSSLDSRFAQFINKVNRADIVEELAKKYLVTANFESYAPSGGGSFTQYDEDGKPIATNRLQGFAEWDITYDGKTYKKGGYGSYHIEMEYVVGDKSGFYPWTRAAINSVHPPKK